jgi:hypothetical protein
MTEGGQRKTLEMFSGSPHMCVCVFGTTFCVGQKSRYIRWTDSIVSLANGQTNAIESKIVVIYLMSIRLDYQLSLSDILFYYNESIKMDSVSNTFDVVVYVYTLQMVSSFSFLNSNPAGSFLFFFEGGANLNFCFFVSLIMYFYLK